MNLSKAAWAVAFNAILLALALWQHWSLALAFLASVIEGILLVSAYVSARQKTRTQSEARKVIYASRLLVLPTLFALSFCLLFAGFLLYEENPPLISVGTAFLAAFAGTLARFYGKGPRGLEVVAHTLPPLVTVAFLFIANPSTAADGSLAIYLFFPLKAMVEIVFGMFG